MNDRSCQAKPISVEWLGRGLRYPVRISSSGGVATSGLDASIRESILIILGTVPGERLMRPGFGCEIQSLVYAENNLSTASLAGHYCVEALTRWEPRIEAIEVSARPSDEEPGQLEISIHYRIRNSHRTGSLVYPFYLKEKEL
jgi:uncharacterized protein